MPSMNNSASLPVEHVRLNAASDGDNAVVSAVTGKKIRVLAYAFTASAAGEVTFQNTAGTPAVYAVFDLAANGGVSYGGPVPAFETAAGTGLEINCAAGVDATGHLTYQVVG